MIPSLALRYTTAIGLVLAATFALWRWIGGELGLSTDERIALAGPCLGVAALLLAAMAAYGFRARVAQGRAAPSLRVAWQTGEHARINGYVSVDPSGRMARAVLPADCDLWLHLPFWVTNEGPSASSSFVFDVHVPQALNRRIHADQIQPTVAVSRPPGVEGGRWHSECAVDRPGGCVFTFESRGERTLYPGWPSEARCSSPEGLAVWETRKRLSASMRSAA